MTDRSNGIRQVSLWVAIIVGLLAIGGTAATGAIRLFDVATEEHVTKKLDEVKVETFGHINAVERKSDLKDLEHDKVLKAIPVLMDRTEWIQRSLWDSGFRSKRSEKSPPWEDE